MYNNMIKDITSSIKDTVQKAVDAVCIKYDTRLQGFVTDSQLKDSLDSIQFQKGEPGADGKDGTSVTMDDVKPVIDAAVEEIKSAIPAPKDGTSVTMDDVKPVIDAAVEEIKKNNIDVKSMFDSFVKQYQSDFSSYNDKVDEKLKSLPSDGKDGRDALSVDVIPEINLEKSYPYGTYAKHKGGLWKSVAKTRGMNGWECLVQGLDSFDVDFDGERTFSVKCNLSDGTVVDKTFKTPNVVEKGVFKENDVYETHDGVTYAGSYWLAKKDNPQGRPGTTDDWRLCVKAGRNGKDVVKLSASDLPKTVKVGG